MNRIQIFLIGALLVFPAGCNRNEPADTSGVDAMAKDLLEGIAGGKIDRVYDEYFADEFKGEMPLKEFESLAGDYRKRLGEFVSLKRYTVRTYRVDGFVDGQARYDVKWEKIEGVLMLNLTLQGTWKIRRFTIDSPQIKDVPASQPD